MFIFVRTFSYNRTLFNKNILNFADYSVLLDDFQNLSLFRVVSLNLDHSYTLRSFGYVMSKKRNWSDRFSRLVVLLLNEINTS